MRCQYLLSFVLASSLSAQALVVPSTYVAADAPGALWSPGFPASLRQQTIIDASHLQGLIGRSLVALSLRRDARDTALSSGTAQWSVRLSTAPVSALDALPEMSRNVGPDELLVYQGLVTAPTSPPTTNSAIPWVAQNVIRVAFQTPFHYTGGNLCVDIEGVPAGSPVLFWPLDATQEPTQGSVTDVGSGCGLYGGAGSHWAFVEEASLVPGNSALFCAYGTPSALAFFFLASSSQANAMDLSVFGAPAGCWGHLNGVLSSITTTFSPPIFPSNPQVGGMAVVRFPVPNQPWILGAPFADQWMDIGQPPFATSNAHQWTVATSLPALGMARVSARFVNGQPPLVGEVNQRIVHVLRLETQ